MEFLTNLWLRLKALARRGQLERDLEDEMSFHLAMREAKLGAPVPARRAFGNAASIKEQCRDQWTFAWLESLAQDVHYALRQLRHDPGFTTVAVLTLALGIGATTAIFTTFDAILWQSVPLPRTEEVVSVLQAVPGSPHMPAALSLGDMEDIRTSSTVLDSLTGWQIARASIVDAGGEPLMVESCRVAVNFFHVAGVQPAMGRGFQAGEDEPGHDLVAVISDDLWRNRFAADANMVGRTIRVNHRDYTVIGVMPPKFKFPRGWRDLWIPLAASAEERQSRTANNMETVGRLKPGRSLGNLASELNAISARLEEQYPNTNRSRRFLAWPIQRAIQGDYLPVWEAMLVSAALFVLLISCMNVANLQFARATSRWREVAIRGALGAGRGRIVRQLLTESVVLAIAGAALGLLVAHWSLSAVKWSIPVELRHYMSGWANLRISSRALVFALGAAAASGILSGLAPAWRCTRTNLTETLKEGGRGGGGAVRHRLRSVLVGVEIALAVMTLAGAGLMVRSFRALVGSRTGMHPDSMLTLRLSLSEDRYATDRQVESFYETLLARIEVLPGVQSAVAVSAMPYSRHGPGLPLTIEGQAPLPGLPPIVQVQAVSLNYFPAMYISRRAGEALTNDTPPRAVISQRMAQRWWPNASPLGRRIRLGGPQRPWITIAGVVSDIPHSTLDKAPRQMVYLPYQQFPDREMNLGIRAAGDPMTLAPAVSAVIRSMDRELPIDNIATLEDLLHQEAFGFAFLAWLMGGMGTLALVLAAIGVYGVVSYLVSQQTHEIGIRLALGASRGRVLGMVFRRGIVTAVFGVIAGIIPAYGLARLMAFAVWGTSSGDSVAMVGVPSGLIVVAAVAILIPARRAMKMDAMSALRSE